MAMERSKSQPVAVTASAAGESISGAFGGARRRGSKGQAVQRAAPTDNAAKVLAESAVAAATPAFVRSVTRVALSFNTFVFLGFTALFMLAHRLGWAQIQLPPHPEAPPPGSRFSREFLLVDKTLRPIAGIFWLFMTGINYQALCAKSNAIKCAASIASAAVVVTWFVACERPWEQRKDMDPSTLYINIALHSYALLLNIASTVASAIGVHRAHQHWHKALADIQNSKST
eukprot:jgi/Chlat1/1151/Chrsp112S01625